MESVTVPVSARLSAVCPSPSLYLCLSVSVITDTESPRNLQQSYPAYNFVTELEIHTVRDRRVLFRPYYQGTYYVRCAGTARRPLTV